MSDDSMKDICEICRREIVNGDPQIRVVADAMVASSPTDYDSLIENRVMVLATFHTNCLKESEGNPEMESVPYIWEARALLEHFEVTDETQPPKPRRHLTIIQGGAR